MASKRDQLQSYQFVLQRMMHALVLRQTDPEHPPFRRTNIALLVGIGLAVLALAAAGVYGMISPGGKRTWQSGDRVLVEKETGTRYVYRNGVLYPTANYTSALLLLSSGSSADGTAGEPVEVSQNSLLDVPRGPLVGIAGAPDSLPPQDRLLGGDWSLCAQPQVDEAGDPVARSVLLVGREPAGTRPVDAAALLVVGPDGGHHLLWRGHRHRIEDDATVAAALALDGESRLRVPQAFLDVIPSGPPLGPITVPDAGSPSELLRPGRVGELYVVQTSSGQGQYYLLLRDRLMPITALQYDIQRSAPATRRAYPGATPEAIPLDPAVVADVSTAGGTRTEADQTDASLPPTRPSFARSSSTDSVCALFAGGGFQPGFVLASRSPGEPKGPGAAEAGQVNAGETGVTTGRGPDGLPLADVVVVPPGHAAVVESMAAPGQPAGSGALSFVSDLGRRYQVAGPDVLGVLGYEDPPVIRLPSELVTRIPAGDPLDPDAAALPLGP